jgi:putative oxidoreductase
VLFLLAVSFPIHNFWAEADPAQRMADMVNFTKNMALVGATLIMAAIPQPWMYSVQARPPVRA